MNSAQSLWWAQAKSDAAILRLLLESGVPECHSLHYLQMVCEKLAKALFWRAGTPPERKHAGFVQFLRLLGQTRKKDRKRLAEIFDFKNYSAFQAWIRATLPLAYELERVAPALAGDGPNTEYPWPHAVPTNAPVDYRFGLWIRLTGGVGSSLRRFVETAVDRFPDYADL